MAGEGGAWDADSVLCIDLGRYLGLCFLKMGSVVYLCFIYFPVCVILQNKVSFLFF